MKIAITGTSSGVGQELNKQLSKNNSVVPIARKLLELSDINAVTNYDIGVIDILINCAGADRGGKIKFVGHKQTHIIETLTTNLLSPIILSHKALEANPNCKIVNITSTNNKQYWPNNLAYSLSKKALSEFGRMLQVDHPGVKYLEIQLGLTKTNFNQNRYVGCEERFDDVYCNPHLTSPEVVARILPVLFDDAIKFIEISP